MNNYTYVEDTLNYKIECLHRENERLLLQIETAEEMARKYKYKYWENQNKIAQLNNTINKIK